MRFSRTNMRLAAARLPDLSREIDAQAAEFSITHFCPRNPGLTKSTTYARETAKIGRSLFKSSLKEPQAWQRRPTSSHGVGSVKGELRESLSGDRQGGASPISEPWLACQSAPWFERMLVRSNPRGGDDPSCPGSAVSQSSRPKPVSCHAAATAASPH